MQQALIISGTIYIGLRLKNDFIMFITPLKTFSTCSITIPLIPLLACENYFPKKAFFNCGELNFTLGLCVIGSNGNT